MRERDPRRTVTSQDIAQPSVFRLEPNVRFAPRGRVKEQIDTLTRIHFPRYFETFEGNPDAFAEAMSRNWYAKVHAFSEVSKLYGLHDVVTADRADYSFAALTVNGSAILIGLNASAPRTEGARFLHQSIDTLNDKEPVAKTREKGAYMKTVPTVGTSLRMGLRKEIVAGDESDPGFEPFHSSQLIKVCAGKIGNRNVAPFFDGFVGSTSDVYKIIDRLTLVPPKR